MFFKKKTETKVAVANGAAKAAPTAGPQPAVEIPPAAPATKAAVAPTPVKRGPNLLENGNFSHWSAGTEFKKVDPYKATADGWLLAYGGGWAGEVNVSRSAEGGILIDVVTPGGDEGWFGLEQRRPYDNSLPSRPAVFSMRAKASTTTPVSLGVHLHPGAGAPAAEGWGQLMNVGSGWNEFTQTFNFPFAPPQGPDATLRIFLPLPKTSAFRLEVSEIHLSIAE